MALWAALASFFATLLAVGVFDIFDPSQALQYAGAFIVAALTGGGVYAKQRLDDAKAQRARSGA